MGNSMWRWIDDAPYPSLQIKTMKFNSTMNNSNDGVSNGWTLAKNNVQRYDIITGRKVTRGTDLRTVRLIMASLDTHLPRTCREVPMWPVLCEQVKSGVFQSEDTEEFRANEHGTGWILVKITKNGDTYDLGIVYVSLRQKVSQPECLRMMIYNGHLQRDPSYKALYIAE